MVNIKRKVSRHPLASYRKLGSGNKRVSSCAFLRRSADGKYGLSRCSHRFQVKSDTLMPPLSLRSFQRQRQRARQYTTWLQSGDYLASSTDRTRLVARETNSSSCSPERKLGLQLNVEPRYHGLSSPPECIIQVCALCGFLSRSDAKHILSVAPTFGAP